MITTTRAELIEALPFEDYLQLPHISRSKIMDYDASPLMYYERHVAGTMEAKAASPAMEFGTMVDRFLTEGIAPMEGLPSGYHLIPESCLTKSGARNPRGKEWREWVAGKDPATCWTERELADHNAVQRERLAVLSLIAKRIQEHETARNLVLSVRGYRQPTIVFDLFGFPVKCRPDILIPGVAIVDIKTSARIGGRHFSNTIGEFGYHVQGWMCVQGWKKLTGKTLPFLTVAIESSRPHAVEVYELAESWMRLAKEKSRRCIEGIRNQRYTSRSHGQVVLLAPPRYARYETEYVL